MANKKNDSNGETIVVSEIKEGIVDLVLLGKTPLIAHCLSIKTQEDILFPKQKKTSAERAATLKHDPFEEFRTSVNYMLDPKSPTLLGIPAAAPKKAMATAALDIPGAKKAQIGRLTYVTGTLLPIYGTPQIIISTVKNSDMNHTTDMRTRCIFPQWVVRLTVNFVTPPLNATTVINLLHAAGLFVGICDWRAEKGAGNYGSFDVLSVTDAERNPQAVELFKQGRKVQEAAMANPRPYDRNTDELLTWFLNELKVRGKAATKPVVVAASA
jgi:hypothetical protein